MSDLTCSADGSDLYSALDDDELNHVVTIPLVAKAVIPKTNAAAIAIKDIFSLTSYNDLPFDNSLF